VSALLNVAGLGKRFGGLQAVQDLSFAVEEGAILGLIGPNGAGKSTVFNLVNGVFAPDEGRVTFAGRDITGLRPYLVARSGLARTHQIVQPFANMSVLENCVVGACFGREDLPRARRHAASAWRTAWRRPRRSSRSPARSASSSLARSPRGPGCCCWTRCWRASIPPRSSA